MKITNQKGPVIPKEFIGLFLEDINYAIDGGLYAEMLENRSFESLDVYGGDDKDYYVKYDGLYAWETDSPGLSLEIVQGSPVSRRNPHYLRAACRQEGGRFWNKAYEGIYMRPSVPYHVSFYARCAHYQGDLRVSVIQEDGSVAAEKSVVLRPAGETGWNRWERYELALCSDREVCGGRFTICIQRAGVVEFDWFSMVPEDAVLGVFRRDLAERLKELRPGFLRFPGGCVAEGATLANRYRFQDTLGPVEDRLYNWNRWALEGNSRENGWHSCRSHYGQTCGIRHILEIVYRAGLQEAIHESFYRIVLTMECKSDAKRLYREKFYAHGLYGLLDEWVKRGFNETTAEMAQMIIQIVSTPYTV